MTRRLTDFTHQHIKVLENASLSDLRDRWEKCFGSPPSKTISRKLLIRALAYEHQANSFGNLKLWTSKKLIAIANGEVPEQLKAKLRTRHLNPGTRLLREWHGKTYIVDVKKDGFAWESKNYASLSALARAITGTKWNGRRFFGLTGNSCGHTDPPTKGAP